MPKLRMGLVKDCPLCTLKTSYFTTERHDDIMLMAMNCPIEVITNKGNPICLR